MFPCLGDSMTADVRSAFIKKLNANKKVLKESAKKSHTSTFLTDEEVCNLLDLDEKVKKIFNAKLTRINSGFDKNGVPYMSVNFIVAEGEHRGTPFSKYHSLDDKDKERYQREVDSICRIYQTVGIDTHSWDDAKVAENIFDTAEQLNADKPGVKVALTRYVGANGDRLNISYIGKTSDSMHDAADEVEHDEADEVEESEEIEETEEETEEESDDADWSEWVGYEATTDLGEGAVTVTTKEFDAEKGSFTVTDENGEDWEVFPDDLTW